MSPTRLRLIAAAILIMAMTALLILFPDRSQRADRQRRIDRIEADVSAAKDAAARAAESAAAAKAAAQAAQNAVPGSS